MTLIEQRGDFINMLLNDSGIGHLRFSLEGTDDPAHVLNLLSLQKFAAGAEPYAVIKNLQGVENDTDLIPEGGKLLRSVVGQVSVQLVEGPQWTLRTMRWKDGSSQVLITAETEELVKELTEFTSEVGVVEEPAADAVDMGFWYRSARGPFRSNRTITSPAWDDIQENYSASSKEALSSLMKTRSSDVTGRLLLLHGPPGTGKTTALRSLAREWSDWCQVDTVLDPEAFFTDPSYLMDVVVGADQELPFAPPEEQQPRKWRLMIIEDCDELIRGEAKESAGQALSRLLNLTDGLLGQGREILVAITTNERLDRLHPAVVRPGRCLAQIEVGELSKSEASQWLEGQTVTRPMTLAELYARKTGASQTHEATIPQQHVGQYL
ncbi:DUF5925 domain-containing protein [Haloglycomyces albus]|uniref:DUF5925 domain-containing protein n=1 Tax=Haloglycomyces albus TaxID=526067 RepID=UPI00046D4235|nr:DUF5925 domain-containing protein [Haloglycomyces albus]